MSQFHPEQLATLGVKISHLVADSRAVKAGDTFVAYPGGRVDGRQFIAQAIANGANAVIWDAKKFAWDESWQVPHLAIDDLHAHAGELADAVYGAPSKKLWMVGVTGTNGKTTCSHWIARTLTELGRKSAVLGTLGNGLPGALQATLNTTPDAISVHSLLAEFVEQEVQAVAMEVSSHALVQGRVNAVHYDVALLTNLSRDHLDYHGDMVSYAAAKRKLFEWEQLKYAVINLDDAYGAELAEALRDGTIEVVGYGLTDEALRLAERLGIRMVFGDHLKINAHGMNLHIHSSWGAVELYSRLIGRFNAANMLGVLAVLLVSGVGLADAVRELEQQKAVAGRMQAMGGKGKPMVVVDYAHTPDALEKALQALKEITLEDGGKVICVFGCGGDRDRGKRPMMGTVASKLADECIITSDNPRSESPKAIIDAILFGVQGKHQVIEDRAHAITRAINMAQAVDAILIAGKGHEEYQEINGVKQPFSDSEIARRALSVWEPARTHPEWVTS